VSPRARRGGATALEFALVLVVFVPLVAGVMDVAWLAFQRSALASSVALGCRAAALVDPGEGDSDWATLANSAEDEILAALASTGAPCEPLECTIGVRSFGADPGRSLGCTVSRDFTPLTSLVLDPMPIESTIVVRMEWQR